MQERELIELAHAWDRAMIANDADAIGSFMSRDWVIIGSDGREMQREAFLDLIRSGKLTHDIMTSEEVNVRVYDNAAVVTARGVSGGEFAGHRFLEVERVTSVFVREEGVWRCVHTHLSRLEPRAAE